MSAPTSTVQEIFDQARSVYLNDTDAKVWSNNKLLPMLKAAYDSFQTVLANNDLSTIDAIDIPAHIVLAAATTYGTLPIDFVWPVKLEERAQGSTDLYTAMVQTRWENNLKPTTTLNYWSFRGDDLLFPGATTNREVLLYYKKLYPAFPTGSGDPVIDVSTVIRGHSLAALSAKVAMLVHTFINQNTTLADLCEKTYQDETFKVVNIYIKKGQSLPARPRPYRVNYRLGGFGY